MAHTFDLVVLGSGPGGYVAAIRAAQLGANVALVEADQIGGTCLNRGCVPTKALLHAAETIETVAGCESVGVEVESFTVDADKIYAFKNQIVAQQTDGVALLLKANGVQVFKGRGRILSATEVEVTPSDTSGEQAAQEMLTATKGILVATGSEPIKIPIPGIEYALTSDELLDPAYERPDFNSLVIIGGGVIGVELAAYYAQAGVEVTVIEALPRILPRMEKDLGQALATNLKKDGVQIFTSAKVSAIESAPDNLAVIFTDKKDAEQRISAEAVLCAVGRRAATANLFGPNCPVALERGAITISENFETSVPGIYAIGDVVSGSIQLAHAASAEGEFVAELLFADKPERKALKVIPSCIYTSPEIASVGISETEAKEQGRDVFCGKYIMGGNCRTVIAQASRSFIKTVFDAKTEQLIGCQMVCERASDLISEPTLAIANGLTYQDLLASVRPHPTFVEGFTEAVLAAKDLAIHMAPPKKRK